MPSCPHKYNRIDDALRSRNHTFFRGEGLSYADTSECYGYLYKTIRCIVKVLKENVQFVPNHRGNVRYPILQDEHIH